MIYALVTNLIGQNLIKLSQCDLPTWDELDRCVSTQDQYQYHQNSRAHVICVDDDPIMRSLIQAKIDSMVARFDEAEDGLEAWSLFQGNTYDLAFIDLEMPNLDGFDLIRCMRGNQATRHMPIVVVSSREDSDAIRTALQAGASSYLVKPVNWSLFQPMVSQLLRLAGMARQLDELVTLQNSATANEDATSSKIILALEGNLLQISDLAARARAATDPKMMTACLSKISIISEGAMSSISHEDQQIRSAEKAHSGQSQLTA